jgi:hypothetical protein
LPSMDGRTRLYGADETTETIRRNATQIFVHTLAPEIPRPQALSRTWTANRLGIMNAAQEVTPMKGDMWLCSTVTETSSLGLETLNVLYLIRNTI